MRYLITLFLFVLHVAGRRRAGAATDIHGTWTAEIHTGKVYLQVRTAPPPDWTRSGNWNGDWSMGQSVPVEDLAGLDQQRAVHHGGGEVRPPPRGRRAVVRGLVPRRPRRRAVHLRAARRLRRRDAQPRLHRRPAGVAPVPARGARRRAEVHPRSEERGLRQADARSDSAREDARRHHRLHQGSQGRRASRSRRSRSWCGRATTASPPSSSRR